MNIRTGIPKYKYKYKYWSHSDVEVHICFDSCEKPDGIASWEHDKYVAYTLTFIYIFNRLGVAGAESESESVYFGQDKIYRIKHG